LLYILVGMRLTPIMTSILIKIHLAFDVPFGTLATTYIFVKMHLALAMAYVPFEMHLAPIWFTFSLRCA
jgi:hypothetical protein